MPPAPPQRTPRPGRAASPAARRGPAIVAELGRPETPQETADRKAAARVSRRANQTWFNLLIAVIASLGIVLFLVLVVVRPDAGPTDQRNVDWSRVASQAQPGADAPLADPELPKSWTANRAEYQDTTADGVAVWGIGFITPEKQYIGLTQGVDANDSWIADQLDRHRATGSTTIGGVRWTVYDRRDQGDTGNLAYALEAELDGSAVVLAGTASDAEFRTLARAVAADADTAAG